MDRQTVYPFEIPYETHVLQSERFAYEALGLLAMDLLGTSTLASGLPCGPTGPASLAVIVGSGRIYTKMNLESTSWGNVGIVGGLAADTNVDHRILKQGLLRDPVTLAITPPGTGGFSINYLIQAALIEADTVNVVLPFVNPNPPYNPWSGPDNTGSSLPTLRVDQCTVSAKAGTAAATGTQTTPAPDAGYTGLYVVTVANGQSAINNGDISVLGGAPFITEKLGDKISIVTGDARYVQIVNARTILTGNKTFFVDPAGSDANSGLNISHPWQTLQHAFNVIEAGYDLAGFQATVQMADGTYTSNVSCNGPLVGQSGQQPLQFASASGNPSACIVSVNDPNGCVSVGHGASIGVQNVKLINSGGDGLLALQGGNIFHSGLVFGACSGSHINVGAGAFVGSGNNYTINGNAANHILADIGGILRQTGGTITLTGTPAFSGAFVTFSDGANVKFQGGAAFSGAATGVKYLGSMNATLNSGGATIPGNSTVALATGAQFV